jgi:cytochrome c553
MNTSSHRLLKFVGSLLGFLLICLILFSLTALGKFLYFPSRTRAVLPEYRNSERFTKTIERPLETGHFHILDETVYSDEQTAPMCLRCHGHFCHTTSENLRAFYNMHSFYLACETCHIRPQEGESFGFQWFDDTTGRPLTEIQGTQGSYGAKIVPLREGSRLDIFPKEELAREFMKMKDTYSDEERKRIQQELMQHISKEAVTCKECHRPEGYLTLNTLGYSQSRMEQLAQLEVIKLIDDYTKFYLPTMFDPNATGRNKEQQRQD